MLKVLIDSLFTLFSVRQTEALVYSGYFFWQCIKLGILSDTNSSLEV